MRRYNSSAPVDNTIRSDYPLDDGVIEAFRRDGHVVVRGLLAREDVEPWRPVVAGAVDDVARSRDRQGRIDDYSELFVQVTNLWRMSEAARPLVLARRFAGVAARLLGTPSVRLYHDQALFKPPGAARTPWHQDRHYWPLDTPLTVTMWLALVDVPAIAGPMLFASGSHRTEGLGDLDISPETDWRLQALVERGQWSISSTPVAAGDATFHAGGTIHSAGANASDRTREILTVIYFADGARAAVPANENQRVDAEVFLPGVRPGELAASELNPVLYP
ncbi:MAG: phytanoyl-CoA dioxygenase family protein [Thermoanaerobaculia bacterium]